MPQTIHSFSCGGERTHVNHIEAKENSVSPLNGGPGVGQNIHVFCRMGDEIYLHDYVVRVGSVTTHGIFIS